MALLEERKRKFTAEGLFAEERKKPRPFVPQLVGIITSPTGAVIRDMLHGFAERFPTRVIVWPVRVQGETCAAEVAAAIAGFNAMQPGGRIARPDVLIVARGGGSLEDLWGFNEEIVVRAVAASRIPIISAVGHETDWTLIDLVADARAPTPTKAAEWAVPKFADLAESTSKCGARLTTAARRMLQQARAHLKAATRGLPRLEDVLALPRQRFDACEKAARTRACSPMHARITRAMRASLPACGRRRSCSASRSAANAPARCRRARGRRCAMVSSPSAGSSRVTISCLATLSYQSVLQRGFVLVRDADGRAVRSVAGVAPGDRLDLEFGDGRVEAEARKVGGAGAEGPAAKDPVSSPPPAPPGVRRTRGRGGSSQGSLF